MAKCIYRVIYLIQHSEDRYSYLQECECGLPPNIVQPPEQWPRNGHYNLQYILKITKHRK